VPDEEIRASYKTMFAAQSAAKMISTTEPGERYEGTYVHYKGNTYRALGCIDDGANPDDVNGTRVLYENTNGRRFYRTVADFTQVVDPCTGETAEAGVHRFQLVVGWANGSPIVMRDGKPIIFVSQWIEP
jgi:hypothetical protein